MKIRIVTLGCKLNFAESSQLMNTLIAKGHQRAGNGEEADLVIVNTCSVTDTADHKDRQAIHRVRRENPNARIVVTGCYARLKPQEISAMAEVDRVVQKAEDKFVPAYSKDDRTRYFLKVQDGCNYFCTYCTIPFARGRSRNGSIASLVDQARQAASEGGKEIVLTGVNIGDFGRTTGESFLDLLRALDEVEGIERYRISSIEPNLLTDEVLQFCASSRAFMPHFHIPLQSGSDEVLRLMHRRYDTSLFYNKVSRARELMPDCFIGVDVIVGTRGETSALFDEAERFIESLPVSQLHVFSYSERPGTAALRIPHIVGPKEKHERSQRLLAISDRKLRAFYECFIGQVRPVLLEHSRTRGLYNGFTDNYIKVEYHGADCDNKILPLRLVGWNADESALVAIEN